MFSGPLVLSTCHSYMVMIVDGQPICGLCNALQASLDKKEKQEETEPRNPSRI